MSKLLCFSVIALSILLSSATPRTQSVSPGDPQVTLNIPDWWKAPVTINSVKIGEQQVLSGSSITATDDWAKNLSIEATSNSEKTIAYIAYALDFTVAGEKKLYRMRLQDGSYGATDALTAPGGLQIAKGQKHNIRFAGNAWSCQSTLARMINERKSKIVKVELFVESVAFTDDTLWAFGSNLRRIKGTTNFENVDQRVISKRMNHARAPYQSGCCVPVFDYTSGNANPVTVVMTCSSCPPGSGGGSCPQPQPTKEVNSLNGQGTSGLSFLGFTHC